MSENSQQPNYATRRYVARICDLLLFVLIAVAAGIDGDIANETILGLYLIALYHLIYEPLLLLVYGTTPFKWLLGLHIVSATGEPLTTGRKMLRSLYVWSHGYGLGLPIISIACLAQNLYKAIKGQPFTWDEKVATRIEAKPLTTFSRYSRYAMVWVFLISFLVLSAIGKQLEKEEQLAAKHAANLTWENSVTENEVALPGGWLPIDLASDGAAPNVIGKFERQKTYASAALMYNNLPSISNIRTYTREIYATKQQSMDFATLGPISAFSSNIFATDTEAYTFAARWQQEDKSTMTATFIVWQATHSPTGFWHIAIISAQGYSSQFDDIISTMYESTVTTGEPYMSISL